MNFGKQVRTLMAVKKGTEICLQYISPGSAATEIGGLAHNPVFTIMFIFNRAHLKRGKEHVPSPLAKLECLSHLIADRFQQFRTLCP